MTRLVLPGMKARKRGAIVNIGSAVATIAPCGPFYAVYAATKVWGKPYPTNICMQCGVDCSCARDRKCAGQRCRTATEMLSIEKG